MTSPLPLVPRTAGRGEEAQRKSAKKFIAVVPNTQENLRKSHRVHRRHASADFGPEVKSKLDYYESYHNLPKAIELRRVRQKSAAHLAYLQCVEKEKLSPTPVGLFSRSKSPKTTLSVPFAFIGDRLAHALSESLRFSSSISTVNLCGNRLSRESSSRILTRVRPGTIKQVDMSGNRLGASGIEKLVGMLETGALVVLHLEGCQLTNSDVQRLVRSATVSKTLVELNLAKNRLGEAAGKHLGAFLMYSSSLKSLDLHWNCIRAGGATLLFHGLKENSCLEQLDISWNVLDSHDAYGLADAMATALELSEHLRHLDLSFNYLSRTQIDTVAKGLRENHTLLGLHVIGNFGFVDPLGFLHATDVCRTEESNYFRRILKGDKRPRGQNCWLCEEWQECELTYQGLASPPVFLHMEIDQFVPDRMEQHMGKYSLKRAVPGGTQRFFFSNGKTVEVSGAYSATQLHTASLTHAPMTYRLTFGPDCVGELTVDALQLAEIHGKTISIPVRTEVQPRNLHTYSPPAVIREKPQWSLPISLFQSYRFDTEAHLSDCFEFDWASSRLPRLIKDQSQASSLKSVLRRNYTRMYRLFSRETYKFFSCLDPGNVPSIGSNAFTDIAIKSGLIGGGFGLSDLDLVFKNTLFSEIKNNPLVPGVALVRFQFMEMIVRVAIDKYIRSKSESSAVSAVERLLCDMDSILSSYDSNKWRWDVYLCEEVDTVYKAYKAVLDAVYSRFSVKKSKPGQAKFMSLEEFTEMCTLSGLIGDSLVARDVGTCFGLAQMTEIDEISATKHMEMSFVEFLEGLARACDKANVQKEGKAAASLAGKIEAAMPLLLKLTPRALQESFQTPRLTVV